jgi:putative ABC transport system ATP-binding protein
MIELHNISKTYPAGEDVFYALRDISLDIGDGQYISITGPSGAGKSTLLNILGGMIRPDMGEVLVDGKQLYRLPEKERNEYRRMKIGFIFQQFHLIPYVKKI